MKGFIDDFGGSMTVRVNDRALSKLVLVDYQSVHCLRGQQPSYSAAKALERRPSPGVGRALSTFLSLSHNAIPYGLGLVFGEASSPFRAGLGQLALSAGNRY